MRIIIIIITCLLLSTNGRAQNGFSKLYDFCDDTLILSEALGNFADTNMLLSFGNSTIPKAFPIHSYITALDYNGNIKWHKRILIPNLLNNTSAERNIIKIAHDHYIACGTIEDRKANSRVNVMYPFFHHFNSNGDSLRYNTYPDTIGAKYITALVQDGPYIITGGMTTSNVIWKINGQDTYKEYGTWMCKYDTLGNVIWQKSMWFKSLAVPDIQSVVLSADKKNYVFAGRMPDTTIDYNGRSCIVKTDTAGNIIWVNSLKKKYLSEHKIDIVTNPTGGYYFTSSWSTEPDFQGQTIYSQIYYGKLDEQGDTIWTKVHFDTTNLPYGQGHKIAWTQDSNLVIQATAELGDLPVLMKIDTLGNVLWLRTYLHAYNFNQPWYRPKHGINGFSVTPDNRFFMSGYISANGPMPGVYDAPKEGSRISWFVLTDTGGCRYPGDPACWPLAVKNINTKKAEVKIYPNPATDVLTIETSAKGEQTVLELYDVSGRKMHSTLCKGQKETINIGHLPPGMYIVKVLQRGTNVQVAKLVKQ